MSMPIDVSSIDLLFHEESTNTHCHTRALALTHSRRHFATHVCLTVSSLHPSLHRIIYVYSNQLSVLPAGIFFGLTLLT
jgi:hypothetical protein